jgi:hypothetical protein
LLARTRTLLRCLTLRCTRSATAGFARFRTRVNSNVRPHVKFGGVPLDSGLTDAERRRVRALTEAQLAEIDKVLLSHIDTEWRKVALIVGTTMLQLGKELPRLPDIFFASRITEFVRRGEVEEQGDPQRMRFREVRRWSAGA